MQQSWLILWLTNKPRTSPFRFDADCTRKPFRAFPAAWHSESRALWRSPVAASDSSGRTLIICRRCRRRRRLGSSRRRKLKKPASSVRVGILGIFYEHSSILYTYSVQECRGRQRQRFYWLMFYCSSIELPLLLSCRWCRRWKRGGKLSIIQR